MIAKPSLVVFYLLTLCTSICYGQFRVYRADTRSPEEIRRIGGFLPRGQSRLLNVAPNTSMFNHARGAANGQSTDTDGYVSTTVVETTAEAFLGNMFGGTGHVYTIAAASNFVQVAGTLGQYNPYPEEFEYAALGGFRWEQVIGWTQYDSGLAQTRFVTNPDYNARRYNGLRAHPGEPYLAGFPNGHPAWLERPWAAFAGAGCANPIPRMRRKLFGRQDSTCGPIETNVQIAVHYLDLNCPGEQC